MELVRPIYFQGGKILLVELDYTLKMFQRKGNSTLLGKHPTGMRLLRASIAYRDPRDALVSTMIFQWLLYALIAIIKREYAYPVDCIDR